MRIATWSAVLLLLPIAGWTVDPPKPNFRLSSATVLEVLKRNAAESESIAPAARAATPASSFAAQIKPLTLQTPARRAGVSCDSNGNDCVAYDFNGRQLYTIPRWQVIRPDSRDPSSENSLSCVSSNNMLTTFDRTDRCRGIGLLLPTPWEKVNVLVPILQR